MSKERNLTTFERKEVKYSLTEEQYRLFLEMTEDLLEPDALFPHSQILNVYYDTENDDLVLRSMAKPVYKEKLRVRSYGVPGKNSQVFVEIKKKYDGIVYKRRSTMGYREAERFLKNGIMPEKDSQINRELDYFRKLYHPQPAMVLCYDRDSYQGRFDPDFRLTIDKNLRFRETDLDLTQGDWGEPVDPNVKYLMELKAGDSLPLEIVRILSQLKIYPTSFSKYGRAYTLSCQRAYSRQRKAAVQRNTLPTNETYRAGEKYVYQYS